MNTQRIAIVGGECSGKTSLTHALAAQFKAPFAAEYLREFVALNHRTPQADEQIQIAQQQIKYEDLALQAFIHKPSGHNAAQSAPKFLFCDTAPIQTAAYSQRYFGCVPAALWALVQSHSYQHIFLCTPDFLWQADAGQRNGELDRTWVFEHLRKLLCELKMPYTELRGTLPERERQAHEILHSLYISRTR